MTVSESNGMSNLLLYLFLPFREDMYGKDVVKEMFRSATTGDFMYFIKCICNAEPELKCVVMAHTHTWKLQQEKLQGSKTITYCNTGTWISKPSDRSMATK